MSALRQPDYTNEYYSPQLQSQQNKLVQETAKQPQIRRGKVVKSRSFSESNTLPQNLKVLSMVQKASFSLALASMTASIGLYISSVQIPKIWSQEYQNLENLQRQERHLVSFNEAMKYQIAKEAGNEDTLAISNPESALFINPAKIEARQVQNDSQKEKNANLNHSSWGY